MRFLSLFSGIEASSVAWIPLGWECVAVAEIEKFPCSVLKHHYPNVPNLGDINKITRREIENLGEIDTVVFGFPCQDLSVAGQRKGLKNADGSKTRSGLFYVASQICEWSRARWAIAENVPGLFSSNKCRDFAAVVGELSGSEIGVPRDGWRNSGVSLGPKGLVEWATLDAKYFGVPQRRRRVFIVRDSGDWRSRPPLFLVPESLRGNFEAGKEAGQNIALPLGTRVDRGGSHRESEGNNLIAPTMDQRSGRSAGGSVPAAENLICATLTKNYATHHGRTAGKNGGVAENQLIGCLNSVGGHSVPGNSVQDIDKLIVANALSVRANASHRADSDNYIAHSLRADGFDASEDGTGRGTPLTIAKSLNAHGSRMDSETETETETQIASREGVRRLTPVECERLMGFPDGYTDIQTNGKPTPDGPRYKALGNSMVTTVMRWIGQRIELVDAIRNETDSSTPTKPEKMFPK